MRQALEMALEALQHFRDTGTRPSDLAMSEDAITAIKEALAQPEQEPVMVIGENESMMCRTLPTGTKLYTTPPQRKPLTDEQRREIAFRWRDGNGTASEIINMVEAAHGIKE